MAESLLLRPEEKYIELLNAVELHAVEAQGVIGRVEASSKGY